MKEFRVVLKNKPGTLADLLDILGRGGVNIKAIATQDKSFDEGITHIITDDPDTTKKILEKNKIPHGMHDILAIKLLDRPGELSKICRKLANAKINMEFIYIVGKEDDKTVIAITPSRLNEAEKILKQYL